MKVPATQQQQSASSWESRSRANVKSQTRISNLKREDITGIGSPGWCGVWYMVVGPRLCPRNTRLPATHNHQEIRKPSSNRIPGGYQKRMHKEMARCGDDQNQVRHKKKDVSRFVALIYKYPRALSSFDHSTLTICVSYYLNQIWNLFILVGVDKTGTLTAAPAECPIKMIPTSRKVTDHARRLADVLLPPVKALIGDPGVFRQMKGANMTMTSGFPWNRRSSVTGSALLRSVTPRPSNMLGKTLKYEQSA